jgi:hypothetical protein
MIQAYRKIIQYLCWCRYLCPYGALLAGLSFVGILKPLLYAVIICLLFMVGSITGRLTGHWQASISNYEYSFHAAHLQTPFYQHNRGHVPVYNKDAWMRMMAEIKKSKSVWPRGQKSRVN